jgi:hypothetical protein
MILALEALYNPYKRESARATLERAKAAAKGKVLEKPKPIVLPSRQRKTMQEWVDKLIERRQPFGWRYNFDPPNKNPRLKFHQDISSTQMALLALNAASRCRGIRFDRDILYYVIDFCLDHQEKPTAETKEKGRGFAYHMESPRKDEKVPTGAMTTAGCASLMICKSMLLEEEKYRKELSKTVDRAIADALLWIEKHWTVRRNPGRRYYYYYYMYGLERVGDLQNSLKIGSHFWFNEGAQALLTSQNRSGSWRGHSYSDVDDILSTAFALLFLDRSTGPVMLTRAK